jgi:hypothetical protein
MTREEELLQAAVRLTKERDDLIHLCETQRLALEQLRRQLNLKSRGERGFGSTEADLPARANSASDQKRQTRK